MTYTPPTHNVRRWHYSPSQKLRDSGDTIRAHCQRMVGLGKRLFGDMPDTLINAILYHDDPELWLGDLSPVTKVAFPELATAYLEAEQEVIRKYGIPQPMNVGEREQVKLLDMMDAYMWMLNHDLELVLEEDWRGMHRNIKLRASDLGISQNITRFMCNCY